MSKLNLDRSFQRTFPIQNYIAQFSLNYIYTHGDILGCTKSVKRRFQKFFLCRIFMVGVFCSARCCKLLLLSLLHMGQRKFTIGCTYMYTGFLTDSVQQVNIFLELVDAISLPDD